jgi:hypothetical protein
MVGLGWHGIKLIKKKNSSSKTKMKVLVLSHNKMTSKVKNKATLNKITKTKMILIVKVEVEKKI